MSNDDPTGPDDIGVVEIAGAAARFARGLVRPRPVDRRLLASIEDRGLPAGDVTVTVRALPQVVRRVPAVGVVEGAGLGLLPNAMTTYVVEHPDATFLVDPGYCRDAPSRAIAELPWLARLLVTPPADTISSADGLLAHPPTRPPDFALPTHAHWDHVCGLLDLPDLPVRLRTTERQWALDGAHAPAGGVRSSLSDGRPIIDYDLDGPPVATFTASHDLFGDGSVIVVDLAGHTPGSVGVLARTTTRWVLLAGDAAWHTEQVQRVRQKPAIPGEFADEDRDAAFATLHRLHLARHRVHVVPTHDADASGHLCDGRFSQTRSVDDFRYGGLE
ncbi:MBL fold metallo-hydrolase [Gordonia sp. SID5947]|uniref:MBL fold metallo-hydrolase n=1 Tax=Gordonia sp. SID5947 TaxID=2690315 RepID=UPI00136F624D|nr:MBL fold metallo-hydrolase [Gordonia sp. SID5947]MYR07605.1 MBL fold metallo-hydrolase [Gordonia sp. SID5947]